MTRYETDITPPDPDKYSKQEQEELQQVADIVDAGLQAIEKAVEEVCRGRLHLVHAVVLASISKVKPVEGQDVRDLPMAESAAAYGVADTLVPLMLHYLETIAQSEGGGVFRVPIGGGQTKVDPNDPRFKDAG